MPVAAVAAVAVVGSLVAANQAKQAAKGAAAAQQASAQKGIDEQRYQFDEVKKLLAPFVTAGTGAVGGQQALLGLSGPEAQKKAIEDLQSSPQFQAITQQGENAILSNASATGGLRGGNVQGALAQFRPAVLSSLIDQQFNRLGQVAQLGQASAAGQAAAGMQTGTNISNLFGQQGQAQAGGILAQGQANAQTPNLISSLAASYAGAKF